MARAWSGQLTKEEIAQLRQSIRRIESAFNAMTVSTKAAEKALSNALREIRNELNQGEGK